jgi:hypothetical protein
MGKAAALRNVQAEHSAAMIQTSESIRLRLGNAAEMRLWFALKRYFTSREGREEDRREKLLSIAIFAIFARRKPLPKMKRDFAEIKRIVAEMNGDAAEMERIVAEMKRDATEMESNVANIKGSVTKMNSNVADLIGNVTDELSIVAQPLSNQSGD